jgi:hypothetical protein
MFIEVKPVSCQSYNYDIVVHLIQGSESDVLLGGVEVMFGDGVGRSLNCDDFEPVQINKEKLYYKLFSIMPILVPGNT